MIAHVVADGHGVALQHLVCDSHSGQWRLSKQYRVDDAAAHIQTNTEIVYLSWENSRDLTVSRDNLAVIDACGRISIYGLLVVVNRLKIVRAFAVDPEDDLNSIVGMIWLRNDRNPVGWVCLDVHCFH